MRSIRCSPFRSIWCRIIFVSEVCVLPFCWTVDHCQMLRVGTATTAILLPGSKSLAVLVVDTVVVGFNTLFPLLHSTRRSLSQLQLYLLRCIINYVQSIQTHQNLQRIHLFANENTYALQMFNNCTDKQSWETQHFRLSYSVYNYAIHRTSCISFPNTTRRAENSIEASALYSYSLVH